MSNKALAIQNAQRFAYDYLSGKADSNGKRIEPKYMTNAKDITVPAQLIQEQQLTNATNTFTFDFSLTAPQPSATLNNIVLGKNQVAVMYGIQFLLGEGSSVANRVYRTWGPLAADNSFYNGTTKIQYEQSQFIINMNNQEFYKYDGINKNSEDGLLLLQPLRVISGELGVNQVIVQLPSIAALTFTSNLYMSCRLHVALGQPKG